MINESIILLTYYYNQEDGNHRLLRHIIKSYCPAYLPWELYLYEPLQKVFSRVIIYDYLKRRAEVGIKAMNEEIIELVRREHAKYVLWTSFYYDVQESTLETIRQDGATVIGWFFDDEWRFDSYSRYWIPFLDYCVTNAVEAVPKYKALNARVIQTIPNTGIAIERDWSKSEEKHAVSFVGNTNFADRKRYIAKLKERKIPVSVFGGRSGRYLSFSEMIDVFSTSKINLNFSKAGAYYWVRQIKGRVFQVCLAGGFLLTEYAPGIESYFEIDKEIVCFENEEEMVDKIVYYLEHETERRAIARAGWKRANNEHTSFHMVSSVFSEIEQDWAGGGGHPGKLEMPLFRRTILPAQYHFHWGKALMEEGYERSLWKDALAQSLASSPLNIAARYYSIVGFLPPFVRPTFFSIYHVVSKLPGAVFRQLRATPLRKALQSLMKRLV